MYILYGIGTGAFMFVGALFGVTYFVDEHIVGPIADGFIGGAALVIGCLFRLAYVKANRRWGDAWIEATIERIKRDGITTEGDTDEQ